ncbi:MAG: GNAT family N-acetyltransferase [Candidatus Shapirobacteria bacterium]|nr:GNAT family N-acetyltransferase [Candidatus Shapirobacteria bacterium]
MEKPPGGNPTSTLLNNIPLVELPQKEIVSVVKKIFNGVSKDLMFKVEADLERCHELWEIFSPKKSLFDLWDFRLAFWKGYHFDPYFITLSFQGKPISVLPLWFDTDDQQYSWFGGNWPEENKFFTTMESTVPLLLKLIPGKAKLQCISPQAGITDQPKIFAVDEEKYVLPIENFKTMDDYWATLKKKKRYNLKRDFKRIEALNPQTVYNDFSHLENLFKLNISRFDGMVLDDGKSTFLPKEKQVVFREIVKLAGDYQVRMISTLIKNKIVAVDLVVLYNQAYYCLAGGCAVGDYSGLGSFANLQLIKDAISLGDMKAVDFLQGDLNWKSSWKSLPKPLYKFEKET